MADGAVVACPRCEAAGRVCHPKVVQPAQHPAAASHAEQNHTRPNLPARHHGGRAGRRNGGGSSQSSRWRNDPRSGSAVNFMAAFSSRLLLRRRQRQQLRRRPPPIFQVVQPEGDANRVHCMRCRVKGGHGGMRRTAKKSPHPGVEPHSQGLPIPRVERHGIHKIRHQQLQFHWKMAVATAIRQRPGQLWRSEGWPPFAGP